MLRKFIVICLSLMGFSIVAHAQLGAPVSRLYLTADTAEVVKNDAGGLELVVTGNLPDGCEAETTINTERIGVAWFVDMYRELPIDTMCPAVLQPYEQRIDASALLELDEDATLPVVLIINGKIYGVNHAQIDGASSEAPAPMLDEYWVRSEIALEAVTIVQNEDGSANVPFSIHQTDGCAQTVYRAYGVWDQEGLMMLEVYNIIPINAMCEVVDRTMDYSVDGLMFYTLSVNGVNVPHNTVATSTAGEYSYIIQSMGLDSATAEWVTDEITGARLVKITAKGITDGCEFPIQIVPAKPVDNIYTVQVVRVAPIDTACTMIAREFIAERAFDFVPTLDAPLTLNINDKTVELPLE